MRIRPIAIWSLPLAIVLAAAALIAGDPGGAMTRLGNIQFDTYQYWAPRTYEDPGPKTGLTVRALDFDDAAMAKHGDWPWPPAVLADLTRKLKGAGAAMVVFATPLNQEEAVSPARFAAGLPPGPDNDRLRKLLAKMPTADQSFVSALGEIRTVTGFTLGDTAGRTPDFKAPVRFEGPRAARETVPSFAHAAPARAGVEKISDGVGALNLIADADGKYRSVPLVLRLGERLVPSLDAEAMRLAAAQSGFVVQAEGGGGNLIEPAARITAVKTGLLATNATRSGALAIHFAGAAGARRVTVSALEDGKLKPGVLKNAIVYIADPARWLETPNGLRNEAGVRAEAMENILLGEALRPVAGGSAQMVFVLVAGIAMVLLFARVGALWAGAATLLAILGAQAFTWSLFSGSRILLDSLTPSLALGLAFAAGMAARSIEVVRARIALRSAFADSLAPLVLDRIARAPALLKLDGEMRTVTCMSCGVRGYAELADTFREDPQGFTRLMRTVMAPLVKEVFAQGGTIGTFGGEGFTAFWNAPLDDAEHAIHACEAANKMTIALAQVNEQLSRERRGDGTGFTAVEIGIAITTGPAIAGGFGEGGRMAYAVTGDCTVLAERIRVLSPQYGPAVIVSDDTRKAAERGFAFLEVDYIAIGVRDEAVKLYAMLGNPLMRASPKFRAMATFHDHIFQSLRAQQWGKARELIEQCRKLSGASQKMYDLHLKRIAWFEANPPGADWDGAFRAILR